MNVKFGWRRTPHYTRRLHLADYLRYPIRQVAVPAVFDYAGSIPWSMLGNDEYGDCVEAAMLHAVQVYTDAGYIPTRDDALTLYHNLTGWTPQDPNSDQGTIIADALAYWVNNQITPQYTRSLNTYLSVDVNNMELVNAALYLSGSLLIGFDVPYSAMQQFQAGQLWDVVPGSPIVGGHCISLTGIDLSVRKGISWAREVGMTDAFWNTYVSEAWMLADEDWVSSYNGKAANLLDFNAINADVEELWPGSPVPFVDPAPIPTPPTPPITKDPITTLSQIRNLADSFFAPPPSTGGGSGPRTGNANGGNGGILS